MPQEITESWNDKIYELKFTDKFFQTSDILLSANESPNVPNVMRAYSAVKALANALVYNNFYMEKYNKQVKPALETIDFVLYGNPDNDKVLIAQSRLDVIIEQDAKTNTKTIKNIQNIIKELYEIFFLIKQWAYEEGFFAKKPFERKYGKDAISDIMQM